MTTTGKTAPTATVTSTSTTTPTFTPTGTVTATGTNTPTLTVTTREQVSGPCPCAGDTLNCSDFSTQSQAQACMNFCISQGVDDIHNLDGNADGEAYESLPGGFQIVR